MRLQPCARIPTIALIGALLSTLTACEGQKIAAPPTPARRELRVAVDRASATLNPRHAGDAVSQRLNALIFRGLTRIDARLDPQPDLASSWRVLDDQKTWRFELRPGLTDHAGRPITAEKVAQCLDQYRNGKPFSIYKASFPSWQSTVPEPGASGAPGAVLIRLDRPDPYLARNVSLLRYFTTEGALVPCSEPESAERPLIGSGPFRPAPWMPEPDRELVLEPVEPQAAGRLPLRIQFVADDTARALKMIRGETDAIQNGLSLTKVRWLMNGPANPGGERFELLEETGAMVQYLAFNLRDPVLAHKEVRRAIALSIDREGITRDKLLGHCTPAGSLLSPRLPESHPLPFAYDPVLAEKLLDSAGFKRPSPDGSRFSLRFRTTPRLEGMENALMFQDQLARVGIRLVIDSVEPAVFLASIKKGAFQLYSSRWVGVSDGSILYRTLRSGQPDNRVGFRNVEADALLDSAYSDMDLNRRQAGLKRVQEIMAEELPYFPLWYWNNMLVIHKGLKGMTGPSISLSGAYEPITWLK
jgi:peptide/nickel transport system substrate-binding protein